jgi:hypothetical protein
MECVPEQDAEQSIYDREVSSEKFASSFMISTGHVSLGWMAERVARMGGELSTGFSWENLEETFWKT